MHNFFVIDNSMCDHLVALEVCMGQGQAGRWERIFPTGQASKWEGIFLMGQAGAANEGGFFQWAGPFKEKWVLKCPGWATKKVRRKILLANPGRQIYSLLLLLLNVFPNLHEVCSFYNLDLIILTFKWKVV